METTRADESYMAELRANHPELVVEDLQVYEICKKPVDGAGPSTNPGFGEDDNGDEGSGDDGADWDKLEVEED